MEEDYGIDIITEDIESGITYAPFDQALLQLDEANHRIIPLWLDAQLRITEGENTIFGINNGNYVKEGCVYMRKQRGIIVRHSPFLNNPSLLKVKYSKFYRLADRELYRRCLLMAVKDIDKLPRYRRAILMPSNKPFALSNSSNSDIFDFLFGEIGQYYLDFVKRDYLTFDPLYDEEDFDMGEFDRGTLPTQIFFGANDDWDDATIDGQDNLRDLKSIIDPVRGFRELNRY